MAQEIHVLGISGSLRKHSYNTALLHTAEEMLPEGMKLEIFDLAPMPLYNDDVREQGYPEPAQHFRDRIAAADALLIATPEYNYSVPGVLKNAIDWASRPPDQPLNNKPAAIMGASTGFFGTARAQLHLRQIFVFTNTLVMPNPQVLITQAKDKFDEQGRLTDEASREHVRKLLQGLADWTRRLNQ